MTRGSGGTLIIGSEQTMCDTTSTVRGRRFTPATPTAVPRTIGLRDGLGGRPQYFAFVGGRRSGFTLIELLAATILTAIVLLGVYAVFRQALMTERRVSEKWKD